MRKKGIIRLAFIFLLCLAVILYNIGDMSNIICVMLINETADSVDSSKEQIYGSSASEEERKTESTASTEKKESAQSSTAQSSSVPASAEAVKGKIISKYSSPYGAALSYNKIYMKNSTPLDISLKELFEAKLDFTLNGGNEPQVLVMHTHTTESYISTDSEYYTEDFNSRSADNSKNMVKIGDIITEKLNSSGICTLHDTTQHDNPQYTGSYSRAAQTVKKYLEKYPSIKIVLDLHRDSVTDSQNGKVKLVTEIDGKKAAQVMLVMGSQSGNITEHPNWRENLKLAVKLQHKIEEKYPTLARPILLMSKKYNQNLSKGSLLLEFGTDVNTLDEACRSAELVGNALSELLNEIKQ